MMKMKNKIILALNKNRLLLISLVIILVFPLLLRGNNYVIRVGAVSLLYGLLAISLNLISGVAGQISMGHAAFFAIGAYASSLLSLRLQFPFWACLVLAIIISAFSGMIIGIPSMRMQGGYLAIISLGFSEIIRMVLLNWKSFTDGAKGLLNIPRATVFGIKISTVTQSYYFFVFFLVICYILLKHLIDSRFGRNLRAIKSDDTAAESMGINVFWSKVLAYVISAAIAGLAGSLYAHYMMFISPYSFTSDVSTTILSMVVLGGLGNMYGACLSAVVLTALPETLRSFSKYRMLIYGILLVIIMLSKTKDWNESRFIGCIKERFSRKNGKLEKAGKED